VEAATKPRRDEYGCDTRKGGGRPPTLVGYGCKEVGMPVLLGTSGGGFGRPWSDSSCSNRGMGRRVTDRARTGQIGAGLTISRRGRGVADGCAAIHGTGEYRAPTAEAFSFACLGLPSLAHHLAQRSKLPALEGTWAELRRNVRPPGLAPDWIRLLFTADR